MNRTTVPGSKGRHLLVFAYYVPPLGMSGVQRVSKLLKYLPEYGWTCTLIAPEPAGYFAYDESLLDDIERPGIEIRRTRSADPTRLFGGRRQVGLPAEGRRRFISEASQYVFVPDNKIGWLPFALLEARRVLREKTVDAILSSAPPYTGHLAGALTARSAKLPLMLDFRDDWLENPRHVYPTALHRELHRRLEAWTLGAADAVITINDAIASSLSSRTDVQVGVVPQGFDPQDFCSSPITDDRAMSLTYTGVFYDAQRPDTLLRAARRFLDVKPDARLRLVFAGSLPDEAPRLIEVLGLAEYVDFKGYLPHAEVVREQEAADVVWMVIGHRSGADGISTGKLFEYIGARRPILALIPEGTARRELADHGAAWICDPDSIDEVAQALAELYDRWQMKTLPRPPWEYVARYDRRAIAGDVSAILDAITQPAAAL